MQFMSRDYKTRKSKMELYAMKDNGRSLSFVTETLTPDSTGVLDTPPDVLKNILKINTKIKLNDKITYT